jgi:hypothetical protein
MTIITVTKRSLLILITPAPPVSRRTEVDAELQIATIYDNIIIIIISLFYLHHHHNNPTQAQYRQLASKQHPLY